MGEESSLTGDELSPRPCVDSHRVRVDSDRVEDAGKEREDGQHQTHTQTRRHATMLVYGSGVVQASP